MSLCTNEGGGEVFGGLGVGGLESELSVTCWKGHPSVTPPLNILLNDVPRLLTPADKARKHYTARRTPPLLLLFFFFYLTHSLSPFLSAHHLVLPRLGFLIINQRISPRVFQLLFRLSDLQEPGWLAAAAAARCKNVLSLVRSYKASGGSSRSHMLARRIRNVWIGITNTFGKVSLHLLCSWQLPKPACVNFIYKRNVIYFIQ